MNDEEFNKIVEAWVTANNADDNHALRKANHWAIDTVMDWSGLNQTELLWRFVLATYKRDDLGELTRAVLAAGPLEELLSKAGAEYIDRIEALASEDAKFNYLLGGVWQLCTPDNIWARVEKVRRETW